MFFLKILIYELEKMLFDFMKIYDYFMIFYGSFYDFFMIVSPPTSP